MISLEQYTERLKAMPEAVKQALERANATAVISESYITTGAKQENQKMSFRPKKGRRNVKQASISALPKKKSIAILNKAAVYQATKNFTINYLKNV